MNPYWLTCLHVAQLITLAPHVFGGVIVHARSGPVRERWLQTLEQLARHHVIHRRVDRVDTHQPLADMVEPRQAGRLRALAAHR